MNCNLALSLNPCLARSPRRALARGRQRRLQKKSTVVRSALSTKQPTEEGAGAPGVSSDPFSSMMNFISDVNPLASVFKSPDGASRRVPSTRGTLPLSLIHI